VTPIPFAWPGFRGEAAERLAGVDLVAAAQELLDPGAATGTLHWGRNYIYAARLATPEGELAVAVKQFRGDALRERRRRRRGEGKAARSFAMARALREAGIATPEPLLVVESLAPEGVSIYVSALLEGRLEARYFLRARNAGREREEFPAIDGDALLAAVGGLARRLHDTGFLHRDLSIGNLLVAPGPRPSEIGEIALLDLNRCRQLSRVGQRERMRDLCRLPLERAEDRRLLLAAYFGGDSAVPPAARRTYERARRRFAAKHRLKNRLRESAERLKRRLLPRRAHAHIPPPPGGAAAREKIVWDHLSDQPHSHARPLERAAVRLADLPAHARAVGALLAAAPRAWRRYRQLVAERHREPGAWPGAGVALRPWPRDPAALLAAFDELGLRQALLRLHPWQEEQAAEEELAGALAARGVELTFALAQVRELVRDRARWRAAVGELGRRFLPYGRRFQIGQAVNRSKWGIWRYDEYLALAGDAAEILRGLGEVELAGPPVIDFEAHVTTAIANLPHPTLRFDALASLLYVDRRGAPENRQLGFDTEDKVTLLAAIAETSRRIGQRRQWITEVNWPLAEGPHSPAGRNVAVGEQAQADYLARFYLAALGSGYVERVFWWQLVARGYGLIDPEADGLLRRRPAFAALATLARELDGARCHGPQPGPPGARLYRFSDAVGEPLWVAWALGEPLSWHPPAAVRRAVGRDGDELPAGAPIRLTASPCYLRLASVAGAGERR